MKATLRIILPPVFTLLFSWTSHAHNVPMARAELGWPVDNQRQLTLDFDLLSYMAMAEPGQITDQAARELAALSDDKLVVHVAKSLDRLRGEIAVTRDRQTAYPASATSPAPHKIRAGLDQVFARGDSLQSQRIVLNVPWPSAAREATLTFPVGIGAVALRVSARDADAQEWVLLPGETSPAVAVSEAAPVRRGMVVVRYLMLGFAHIVPKGLDHILFVLGLFLLNPRWRPLLWQVTAFTIAHSITLALSIYGVFSLPPRVVEPLIAASIAFIAIENVCTTRLNPWRLFVVFGFGLVHGLGFASVLTELGLPRSEFLTALITFNLGVEGGQLAVVGMAALATAWCFGRPWYRQRIAIPASIAIACMGIYWCVERIGG